jgi:lipoyl-dependent peroxiredoxin subunit D
MSIEAIKSRIPDYARDLRLNIGNLAAEPALSDVQRAGTFIACAIACREPSLIEAIVSEFAPALSAEQLSAAKSAAAIMAMNNIYYRFTHLTSNAEYGKLPAKLRMNVIANPGADKQDFELWALAVSAINGCGMCVDSHEKILKEHGVTTEQIQAAVRIASVVHAVAVTLESEQIIQTELAIAA